VTARVEYTGRHTEVPAGVRRLGDRKLRKLERVLPGITDVRVILTEDKHRQIVEVTVHSRGLDLVATEESSDFQASLSTALDKLTRQATRHRDKTRVRKGGARVPAGRPRASGRPQPEEADRRARPRVIRNRRVAAKPMTVGEAALEVGESADGVVVFRDATTGRIAVLYRRKDGHMGLIEPEA
jgi:putative sigma-54 modulation protein